MTKKFVERKDEVFGRWETYTRDRLVSLLDESLAKLPEECRKTATFVLDDYQISYNDNTYYAVYIKYKTLETDVEEEHRESMEACYKQIAEEREKAEFIRLSAKFKA